MLREEIRIKDARMELIAAARRPHYPPVERLAILELRAARSWSQARTAERFQITPLTIASWMGRLDEEGPGGLVQMREPVNKFPDLVGYLVRRLKVLCPTMGTVRIARVLARAGLHLGPTTVRRMLRQQPGKTPAVFGSQKAPRSVQSRKPNEVWHVDLTTVPTSLGFWIPWLPWALPPSWPFCWWVAVAIDHHSRRVMGFSVFRKQPTAPQATELLQRVIRAAGCSPKILITDKGVQFTAIGLRRWCRRSGIQQRFGAVGKYGSIAVIERLIGTMKRECIRRLILVPLSVGSFRRELADFIGHYNAERPHERLMGATPNEKYFRLRPACRAPRFEPRVAWPRRSRCAQSQALVRGRPGVKLELIVEFKAGRKHLPVVELRRAA